MKTLSSALFAFALFGSVASASTLNYQAFLSGPNEAPPNASPGTGFATFGYDTVTHILAIDVSFSGLLGTTIASHIHCCTTIPGVGTGMVATQTPTFIGFPLGVTSGTYNQTFDMTLAASYNPAFVTQNGGTVPAAEAALLAGFAAGTTYLNLHTSVVPGGEIRGFLEPVAAATPEPATFVMGAAALAALAIRRRLIA